MQSALRAAPSVGWSVTRAPEVVQSTQQGRVQARTAGLSQASAQANTREHGFRLRSGLRHDRSGLFTMRAVASSPSIKDSPLYTSVLPGEPQPLGPSKQGGAVNFALYAKYAKAVTLVLLDSQNNEVDQVLLTNKTGDVWHVALDGLSGTPGVCYSYRVSGDGGWDSGMRWTDRLLLDPYAPLVNGRRNFGKRDEIEHFEGKEGSRFTGTFDFESEPFDWGEDAQRKRVAWKDLVVYEMPVHAFTASPSSGVPEALRGTYMGVAEKASYLAELGVTAVELLPVFEYDEMEFQRHPNPRDHMVNTWGYSHINFFAPMSRFATNGQGSAAAAREFKEMVKSLHAAGVEVLVDVVYNHTAEADDHDPYTLSFRGIESKTYYMTDVTQQTQLINYSGCGNTVNANHPMVKQLIIDSLVHWVTEYHVDGFRFDLASCLCRDEMGKAMPVPPLIETISKHPLLSTVRLIAEPWDLGMYQVGSFPNWDVWAEWNGMYRDDLRCFIKGDPGKKRALATRLCGSADLYQNHNRKPYHSVNFVTAHDGFSLYDMMAYNDKHNDANGESNRDGSNDNFSWNCGVEGPTDDANVNALRQRQMRNALLVLLLSAGTPMILMGDESSLTHNGNNNWYGHDQPWTQMQWQLGEAEAGMLRFTRELLKLRHQHPALGRDTFMGSQDVTWHESDWENDASHFLAFTLHAPDGSDLYAAFNAHGTQVTVDLPAPPSGKNWCRIVDTNLPSPRDFTPGGNKGVDASYGVSGFSSILLMAK